MPVIFLCSLRPSIIRNQLFPEKHFEMSLYFQESNKTRADNYLQNKLLAMSGLGLAYWESTLVFQTEQIRSRVVSRITRLNAHYSSCLSSLSLIKAEIREGIEIVQTFICHWASDTISVRRWSSRFPGAGYEILFHGCTHFSIWDLKKKKKSCRIPLPALSRWLSLNASIATPTCQIN